MEILSGIREIEIFTPFSERLSAFTDKPISSEISVKARGSKDLTRTS
jgi:hypothetical protein